MLFDGKRSLGSDKNYGEQIINQSLYDSQNNLNDISVHSSRKEQIIVQKLSDTQIKITKKSVVQKTPASVVSKSSSIPGEQNVNDSMVSMNSHASRKVDSKVYSNMQARGQKEFSINSKKSNRSSIQSNEYSDQNQRN